MVVNMLMDTDRQSVLRGNPKGIYSTQWDGDTPVSNEK